MSNLAIAVIDCVESIDNFVRFKAEPLEKGISITLGNSLRRVLLSYLPGAAVTRVRIEGIQHEFSIIPHAKEDVMEFLLNVKALRLKTLTEQPGKLTLEVKGEGPVHAADIKPSADFEITNPELLLLTMCSAEASVYIEFDVELGTGYRQAEPSDNMPVGTIPVDAIFSPVRKANFSVEPTHIGRETSRERLFLEVWTDGTMSPVDAVSRGASILMEQLAPFHEYAKISQMKAEERLIRLSIPDEKYNTSVDQLDLSVRTMNCLRRSNITTVGELIAKGPKELLKLRNFGQKSYQEIEGRLEVMGLSLTPNVEQDEDDQETAENKMKNGSAPDETSAEEEIQAESEKPSGESPT